MMTPPACVYADGRPNRGAILRVASPFGNPSGGSDRPGPSYFDNDEVGAQLYFNSNRPGGPGTSNIYPSEQLADGSFGAASFVLELNGLGDSNRSSIRHDGRKYFYLKSPRLYRLWNASRQ